MTGPAPTPDWLHNKDSAQSPQHWSYIVSMTALRGICNPISVSTQDPGLANPYAFCGIPFLKAFKAAVVSSHYTMRMHSKCNEQGWSIEQSAPDLG